MPTLHCYINDVLKLTHYVIASSFNEYSVFIVILMRFFFNYAAALLCIFNKHPQLINRLPSGIAALQACNAKIAIIVLTATTTILL